MNQASTRLAIQCYLHIGSEELKPGLTIKLLLLSFPFFSSTFYSARLYGHITLEW